MRIRQAITAANAVLLVVGCSDTADTNLEEPTVEDADAAADETAAGQPESEVEAQPAPDPEPAPDEEPELTPEPEPDPEPETEPALEIVDGPHVADATDRDWTWDEVRGGQIEQVDGALETFTGTGDAIIDFATSWDVAIIDGLHEGSRNFIVRTQTVDGEGRGVFNTIGNYEGRVVSNERVELVGLNVRADGPWAIVVRNVFFAQTVLASSYQGTGDSVILFPIDGDNVQHVDVFDRFHATHDGERNFIVRNFLGRGLINEIGPYDGTVRLPSEGIFGLEISADGNWTIEFE